MEIEEIRDTPLPTPIRSPRTYISPLSSDRDKLQELRIYETTPSSSKPSSSSLKPKPGHFMHYNSVFQNIIRRYSYMFRHLKQSFMLRNEFKEILDALKSTLKKVVPPMVDKRVNEIAKSIVPLYVAEGLLLNRQTTQIEIAPLIAEARNKE
ncbi:hypothetical protein Tco_0279653 [Tanacetum coccineum]